MAAMKIMHGKSFATSNAVRSAATVTIIVLFLYSAHGENLTTLDGKTYTNIVEIAKYPKINLIVFTYNSNRTSVAVSNLPEEFREKYGIKISTNSVTPRQNSQPANSDNLLLAQFKDDTDLNECDHTEDVTNNLNQKIEVRSWQICLQQGIEVSLNSYTGIGDSLLSAGMAGVDSPITLKFKIGEEKLVDQAFEKFNDWYETAAKNHVEDFNKDIVYISETEHSILDVHSSTTYTFNWNNGDGKLFVNGSTFDKQDVIHFQELLNKLPGLKEKLVEKIRNKESQKELFK